MIVVVVIVAALIGLAAYIFAEEISDLYGRYEAWVTEELSTNLGFFGWKVDPGRAARFLRMLVVGGFVVGVLISLSPVVGLYLALLAGAAPIPVVRVLRARRWSAFDDQLLDGINLLRNALRSGLTLQGGMEVLVRELQPPISEEFDRVLKETKVGLTMEEALDSMNERLEHPELDLMVTAIATLRRTGANMAETFDVISHTIEERVRVEGRIRALIAQGMTQAYILVCMPFILAFIIYLMDPNYIAPLFETVLGWFLLTLMTGMVVTGWMVIKRLVTIEV